MAEVYERKPRRGPAIGILLLLAALVVGIVTLRTFSTRASAPNYTAADGPLLSDTSTRQLQALNQEFTALAKAALPAVVNISTTRVTKIEGTPMEPLLRDPFFRRFFGPDFFREMPREQRQHALGSGVIIGREGFIITNNHVVEKATEIKIALPDKRTFIGKVVGADPSTDVAVVRIQANNLPALPWGDSDKLQVGEIVMAIGNPFGLNQTVTRGIVSAIGRANLHLTNYENFIQTDAAINPGNSGGALVNIRGELVGVNTAILSSSGGFNGVGLAVPSNLAKDIMKNLIQTGKVVRGWLGVQIQPITPELAKQFGVKEIRGALVGDVTPNSPAAQAGLQSGDVIIEYNGKTVEDSASLSLMVAQTPVGSTVPVKILRQGREQPLQIKIGERPKELAQRNVPREFGEGRGSEPRTYNNALKGMSVDNLTPDIARRLRLRGNVRGVVITDLDSDSLAQSVGLQPGDVITEINRQPVTNTDDFDRIARSVKPGEDVLLRVNHGDSSAYIVLSPSPQ